MLVREGFPSEIIHSANFRVHYQVRRWSGERFPTHALLGGMSKY
jgi:hypothetical protein